MKTALIFASLLWAQYSQAADPVMQTFRCLTDAEPGIWVQYTLLHHDHGGTTVESLKSYNEDLQGNRSNETYYSNPIMSSSGEIISFGLNLFFAPPNLPSLPWHFKQGKAYFNSFLPTDAFESDITCAYIGARP